MKLVPVHMEKHCVHLKQHGPPNVQALRSTLLNMAKNAFHTVCLSMAFEVL